LIHRLAAIGAIEERTCAGSSDQLGLQILDALLNL